MAIIGLDATSLSIYGKGVSSHQYNLIKSLSKIDKKNCYYIFLNKRNLLPELPKRENFNYIMAPIPKRIIWDQFQLPVIIMKYKLDIYHCLIDTLPIFGKTKFILGVAEIPDYRIALMHRSDRCSLYTRISNSYTKFFFLPSLKKARVIIVYSGSTKSDLIQKYNICEEKIRVLYHGVDDEFCAIDNEENLRNTRKKYNAQEGYILHISSSDQRENTQAVIRAYKRALYYLRVPKKLVICGDARPQDTGLKKLIAELNLENNIIFTGYKIKKELARLYQAADLFIEVSFYEGFGLQVVEAMSCGIPVIASNVTSLPEVVGDAGILVNPTNIDDLTCAMIQVLTDSELHNKLRQKSLERAKFFSWDETAQETLGIYNELLA